MFLNKKAQSTLEYAIVIAVVVAALLTINGFRHHEDFFHFENSLLVARSALMVTK